jgi:hypothetical protein
MTKTIIITALTLSLTLAGPAQAWPEQASSVDCAWGGEPTNCKALSMALVHEHALAHSHQRKAEHATVPSAPSRLPDRDDDPMASMHFE